MPTDNVYGENHPPEEDSAPDAPSVREQVADADKAKGTADDLDETRRQMTQDTELSGGAGRAETPRDGPSQGIYSRPEDDAGEDPSPS